MITLNKDKIRIKVKHEDTHEEITTEDIYKLLEAEGISRREFPYPTICFTSTGSMLIINALTMGIQPVSSEGYYYEVEECTIQ